MQQPTQKNKEIRETKRELRTYRKKALFIRVNPRKSVAKALPPLKSMLLLQLFHRSPHRTSKPFTLPHQLISSDRPLALHPHESIPSHPPRNLHQMLRSSL
jgi:hypothetical protein